jgi:hypothetical protein
MRLSRDVQISLSRYLSFEWYSDIAMLMSKYLYVDIIITGNKPTMLNLHPVSGYLWMSGMGSGGVHLPQQRQDYG